MCIKTYFSGMDDNRDEVLVLGRCKMIDFLVNTVVVCLD